MSTPKEVAHNFGMAAAFGSFRDENRGFVSEFSFYFLPILLVFNIQREHKAHCIMVTIALKPCGSGIVFPLS